MRRVSITDGLAVSLSGLCLVHCVLSLILVPVLAGAAEVLGNPIIHEGGLMLAMLLGALALGQGYLRHRARRPALLGLVGLALMMRALDVPHGGWEAVLTIVGVSVLAVAHLLNARVGATRVPHRHRRLYGSVAVA